MAQSKRVFNLFLFLLIVIGLGLMGERFALGLRIDSRVGGDYDNDAFLRYFWNWFFVGSGLYLVGCLGFGKTLASLTAKCAGVISIAASIPLYLLLGGVTGANFEGWSGPALGMLACSVFIGGIFLLIPSGITWAWKRFKTGASTR
jgi:hypothetical protein